MGIRIESDGVTAIIRPWGRSAGTTAPTGRVLVMPGIGYTVDRPLLYWSARALSSGGWLVDRLDLDLPETIDFPSTIRLMDRAVDAWLDEDAGKSCGKDAGDGVRRGGPSALSGRPVPRLVVTKSLSTLTYPHLADRGVPAILMTPVLNPPPFDPHRSVISVPDDARLGAAGGDAASGVPRGSTGVVPPLVCAGDADPYFDPHRAGRLTDRILVLPGGNHSIEVPGDWSTSLDHLRAVIAAVVGYAALVAEVPRTKAEPVDAGSAADSGDSPSLAGIAGDSADARARANRRVVETYLRSGSGPALLRRHGLFQEDGVSGLWTSDDGRPVVVTGRETIARYDEWSARHFLDWRWTNVRVWTTDDPDQLWAEADGEGTLRLPGHDPVDYRNHFLYSFEMRDGLIAREREFTNPVVEMRALGMDVPRIDLGDFPE